MHIFLCLLLVNYYLLFILLWPCIPEKKPTQRDNADNGVQFITSVGPRQNFLLANDPDQYL